MRNRWLSSLQRLTLLALLACCSAQVGQKYESYSNENPMDESYESENSRYTHGCALRLNRSFNRNPLLQDSEYHERGDMSLNDCIRYSDVNQAFDEARKRMLERQYYQIESERQLYDMNVVNIDKIANILIETTRILSKRFSLSFEEINEALPNIDTSKTDIWKICPMAYRPMTCSMTRFRTIDGSCSSMKNSVWGMTYSHIARVLPPDYDDGINSARATGVDKTPLPNVRKVSVNVHQDLSQPSHQFANFLMSWAQFLAQDISGGAFFREENGTRLALTCSPKSVHPICAPINIPKDDPFYSRFNVTCMPFERSVAAIRPGCALGPRAPLSVLTTRIDASFLYGGEESKTTRLRAESKGLLKSWDKFRDLGLKPLLTPMTEAPERDCLARPRHKYCFRSGLDAINLLPDSVMFHTLFNRFHNSIARELAVLNPHWDDERLFQETRHIVAAVMQHIAYNEFIHLVVGPRYSKMYNLTIEGEGYWYGYDENTPMVTLMPFQSAAFRFGHSLVDGKLRLYNKNHKFVESADMRNFIVQPYLIYRPGTIDKLIAGSLNEPPQEFDRFMTSELTRHLAEMPNETFGADLASLNMNRARDHGVRGYNDYREWCGLPRVQTFEELDNYMSNGSGLRYARLYNHPDDIDLWSAGLSERSVDEGVVGPTFACIIANQFNIYRKADPFWYENPGFPSSFTPGQLREIKKTILGKVICDNSDAIQTLQMWVLALPDPKQNPRVNCKDMPSMNLEYWTEDPIKKTFLLS